MWIYKGSIINSVPDNAQAFVYIIRRTNIVDDNTSPYLYIGKKNFYAKNKNESDWRLYYGSSAYLSKDVDKYGVENFEREILHICYSKAEATWKEVIEQIERRVLRVDKTAICKKEYYNGNILGKFYRDKIFTNDDMLRYKSYMNEIDTLIERKYVTNGIVTKVLDINLVDLQEFLNNNDGWYVGSSLINPTKGKTRVEDDNGNLIYVDVSESHNYTKYVYTVCTDGTTDVYIRTCDVDEFLSKNEEWYIGSKNNGMYKRVNDGINERKIHIGLLDVFLSDNPEWNLGGIKRVEKINYISLINLKTFSQGIFPEFEVENMLLNGWELSNGRMISHFFKWVNDGKVNKKINPIDTENMLLNGWFPGRINNYNKNKICISKENDVKYIDIKDIDNYIELGYVRGNINGKSIIERGKVYVCDDTAYTQFLINKEEVDTFLTENPTYRIGQFKRDNFNTINKVFAIDMRTGDKVTVTSDEYKSNEYLTSVKTRRVKIYKSNKMIFKGYLKLFCLEQQDKVPAFKTLSGFIDNGNVYFIKGKNMKYNELDLRIESMKR